MERRNELSFDAIEDATHADRDWFDSEVTAGRPSEVIVEHFATTPRAISELMEADPDRSRPSRTRP